MKGIKKENMNENATMSELDSLLDSFGATEEPAPQPRDKKKKSKRKQQQQQQQQRRVLMSGVSDDEGDMDGQDEEGTHMVDTIDLDAVDFTPFLQSHSGTAVNYHDESHMDTEHHRKLKRKTKGSSHNDKYTGGKRKRSKWWKSDHTGEDSDPFKYAMLIMLGFIAYVFFKHLNNATEELAVEGQTTEKNYPNNTLFRLSNLNHAPEDTILPIDVEAAYQDVDATMGIMDTPIYWHVPRSGGTTMKLIMSMCMGRTVACEQGAGHQLDEQLELLNKPFGNFANVDTSTPLGLQRAAELGLIPSRMVDVVLTPHVREATKLFDSHHKGRLFALFRDPVERVVSLYYFLRMPDKESVGLNVKDMSLEEFASEVSENWMVRSLTSTMSGPLHDGDVHVAKEILRKKFLVGLLEEKTESLRRIEAYFGWKLPSRVSQTCKNNMFYFEPQGKNVHDPIQEDSREYAILRSRNQFDLELYHYAKGLFEEQKVLFQ